MDGALNPSTSRKGSRDCRICLLRRIRCDRTLPHCLKCAKHKRDCPGYGQNIRWTNAIAVRGHLKGMLQPSKPHDGLAASPSTSSTTASKNHSTGSWAEAANLLTQLVPEAPVEAEICELVDYYTDRIAGNMVWLDCEQNPYRQLVVPLSKLQPVLLLAILAVSAEHMAISQQSSSILASRARDVVISKIAESLHEVTSKGGRTEGLDRVLDLTTAEWILASMLILSNYECVDLVSTAWRLHRQGARTLINSLTVTESTSSKLFRFLRNQFAIHDVLASTTTHLYMSIDDVVVPEHQDPHDMFTEYLRLVHQIDLYSRRVQTNESQFMSLDVLQLKFEIARGSTLMAAGRINVLDHATQHDFICLVDVYHLAGLLYSYHCAYGFTSSHPDVIVSSRMLFERLKQFISTKNCAQNLPWPVFIAGVGSYGMREQQALVLKLFETIVMKTGFNNFNMARLFLEAFWSGSEPNWLKVMEVWESKGRYVLPV